MATVSRTNQTKRPGPASAADDQNIASLNDLAAGKTVTLLLQRMPFPVAIEPLQNLQLLHGGEFNWGQERHRAATWRSASANTIRRTVNPVIGENPITHRS